MDVEVGRCAVMSQPYRPVVRRLPIPRSSSGRAPARSRARGVHEPVARATDQECVVPHGAALARAPGRVACCSNRELPSSGGAALWLPATRRIPGAVIRFREHHGAQRLTRPSRGARRDAGAPRRRRGTCSTPPRERLAASRSRSDRGGATPPHGGTTGSPLPGARVVRTEARDRRPLPARFARVG